MSCDKYFHILLDVSPSMEDKDRCPEPKIIVAKRVIINYANKWKKEYPNPNDVFGVSVFCGNYKFFGITKQGSGKEFENLLNQVDNTGICGATALYDGILKAFEDMTRTLKKNDMLRAALIAITDGMVNASNSSIVDIARHKQVLNNMGYFVKLFVIGLGEEGAKELKRLAEVADMCVPIANVTSLYQSLMDCCARL